MKIARAEAVDLPQLIALERETAEAPHWTKAEYQAIVQEAQGSVKRCMLVAYNNGELVGFAVGKLVGFEAEFESVAVQLSSRRGGIGKALCTALLAWSWEQGGLAMGLEVRASSAAAMALYASLGFLVVGRRRGYYAAPVDDALLMRLERPPSIAADL